MSRYIKKSMRGTYEITYEAVEKLKKNGLVLKVTEFVMLDPVFRG